VALHELERLGERLDDAGAEAGPGHEFLEAARATHAQARKAYAAGEYRKAAELAHGADIWTHVGEHLEQAGPEGAGPGRNGAPPPPPDGRPKRRPPPED
jgi:hypothetical protein